VGRPGIDRLIDRWIDRLIDRWIDRLIDRWIDRLIDRWIDRLIDKEVLCCAGRVDLESGDWYSHLCSRV